MNRSTKRIVLDVKDIMNDPIEDIFYVPDDDLNHVGYAMIIGPKDTPYEYGYYFFKFEYPDNYPFSPPKVIFKTYDGKTRFNPNLYINGYVCLSLLNTWPGEKWSACQSLRSILLSLSTLFNEHPLLNEPGITINNNDMESYNRIIHYRNIEVILKCLNINDLPDTFKVFYPYIKQNFIKTYASIQLNYESKIYHTSIYNLYCDVDYSKLLKLLKLFYNELTKIDG
jgi:ubiquitin-conjugating enzyme E2 Z